MLPVVAAAAFSGAAQHERAGVNARAQQRSPLGCFLLGEFLKCLIHDAFITLCGQPKIGCR
jgi:hypothetical protein